MANYQETTGTANVWKRCSKVVIDNPLTMPSSVRFVEDEVMAVGERVVSNFAGGCHAVFDPAAIIPLRDPETGELTGGIQTQGNLYQILYSLYMQVALARDAAQAQNS